MNEQTTLHSILSGRAGLWATPIRAGLRGLEAAYALGLRARNARYDSGRGVRRVDAPVISVGNITVGGTGKTPVVIRIAQLLDELGASPAVIARGYGAPSGEPNDEERLIRSSVPSVVYRADPDRVAAARSATEGGGADILILDDGFQHRRLHRDLDIVLLDATCPFGFDHVLPRGLLREPVEGLRRAGLILLTRSDQVPAAARDAIERRVRLIAPNVDLLSCRHRVTGVRHITTGEPLDPEGKRVVLFAAIGRPESFRHTAQSLGSQVVGARWFADHHNYAKRDLSALLSAGAFPPHDLILTTAKDAAKIDSLGDFSHAALGIVDVEIDFSAGEGKLFDERIAQVAGKRPNVSVHAKRGEVESPSASTAAKGEPQGTAGTSNT